MNDMPFSIAMSVYCKDNAKCFDRALQSITEQQTVLPNEITLVCDGPISDELNAIIVSYQKRYPIFNVIRLPENQGLGYALKTAIENSKNDLIARMDSDDVSVSNRFKQQLLFFREHPGVDVVGGNITEFIDDEANIVARRMVPTSDKMIKDYMRTRCALNHVTVMFRKKAVQDAGGYKDWFSNEDYYLWIRMQLNGNIFANTGTDLVNVRVGAEMYQRRGGLKYFKSELGLQNLMLKKGMINIPTYIGNVAKRFIVQLILPNSLRGWVFKRLARN